MVRSSKKYSIGKKQLWHQIVIYLIVGTVFYGVVYFFLVAKKGDYLSLGSISVNSILYNQDK
jgi:hypothetical protein